MNVVMIIPTGIGCELGGHAGDASPAARLLAQTCDNLLVHPNIVNASDINEMTENMWYVEGSILDRFLQGQIALEEVYSNKVLTIVNKPVMNESINSINAGRFTIGSDIEIMGLDVQLTLDGVFDPSGKATGKMTGGKEAVEQIRRENRIFDALAIQTVIDVERSIGEAYLKGLGGVNPWGGAEAVCSKYFSRTLDKQCTHAPYESGVLKNFNEVVDPRMAAEVVSVSYIHCILKGLQRAPRVVSYDSKSKATIRVDDIDVMVSPDGCWGAAHDACADWSIPIIFVRENKNIYKPFSTLPDGCLMVDNYIEAAGTISRLKSGVTVASVRR